ncbi:IS4 family transposase [Pseudanabaena sp. FACHB-2040]|uniref:IS4 family transposase n=1 Tax=Pseudanabaena sp. FACHB-2040 TaxID=2692859 RepID=UPI0016825C4D|nr:IS4 family transposase [Pseudanabaena sp. FACHB-2040]MBD2261440.1 IS4 family transposase [Pseudanabaena sp. FACHB-2040]
MSWVEAELSGTELGDARLTKRLIAMVQALYEQPNKSVPEASPDVAALRGMYRFWSNRRIKAESILSGHQMSTVMRLSGHETVLVCQETSDLVYTTLRRTRGLGPISDPSGKGIKVHTALCVSDAGVPLGVLQQKSWTRDMQSRRPGRRRGIEEKESYRWLESLEAVQQQVPEATRVITIADREGDIYELFAHPRRVNSELLIRAAQNRSTKSEPGASEIKALFEVMETIAVSGEMTIALQRTPRRAPREATLSVRYTHLWLQPPQGKGHLGAIPISVILAKEEKRREKESAVEWMLLTTLSIGSLEAAKENLRRYALRWLIELNQSQHPYKRGHKRLQQCELDKNEFG